MTFPVFRTGRFHKRNDEHGAADDDRCVGDVERRPPLKRKQSGHCDVRDIDVDKVDDAFGSRKSVDEISEPAADDAADRPPLQLRKRIVSEVDGEHDAYDDERKDRKQKTPRRIRQAVTDAERDARIRYVHDAQYAVEKGRADRKRRYRFDDYIFCDLVGGNDDERQHERPQSFRLRSIIHSSVSISIKYTIGYRAVLGLGCHGNDMNWQVESFVTFLQNSHYQCL